MSNKELIRKLFLHSPADVNQSYVAWAERLQNEPGIDYGCVLDKHMIPLHPGDLMAVVARPGHGKSSFMAYMAKKTAIDIVNRGAEDEVVIYVTWEQNVEEIEAFFQSGGGYSSTDMAWGRVPLDTIKRNAVKRAKLPIWFVGYSNRHAGIEKPRLYVDHVYEAIEVMKREYGKRPVLLLLDYVQIIPVSMGGKKFEQVSHAVTLTKELLMNLGVAGIAGVQASRDVDKYAAKIPTMSDAQHSSEIEQRADKQIALWRPIKDVTDQYLNLAGKEYEVDESLLVIRLLKQRFDAGFGTWPVRFKPQTLEMFDYEMRTINLNGGSR